MKTLFAIAFSLVISTLPVQAGPFDGLKDAAKKAVKEKAHQTKDKAEGAAQEKAAETQAAVEEKAGEVQAEHGGEHAGEAAAIVTDGKKAKKLIRKAKETKDSTTRAEVETGAADAVKGAVEGEPKKEAKH